MIPKDDSLRGAGPARTPADDDDWRLRTAGKRVEEALRESEELFRTLFESSSVATAIIERDRTVSLVNREYCRLLGCSAEDAVGKSWTAHIVEDDLPRMLEYNRRRLADPGSAPDQYEFRFRRTDGAIRHAIINPAVIPSSGKILCTFMDITERKRAEEALRESEYFFRESQRAARIGSYKTDFTTGVWESSQILDQIFGIGKDYRRSVQGWLDLVHPDDRDALDRYLRDEVVARRRPFAREYRIVRQNDGAVRWVSGFGNVTFDAAGAILSMIGTIQDITERKRAEQDVRSSEQQLRSYLDGAGDAIYALEVATGRIRSCNARACHDLGYSREELLELTVAEIEARMPSEDVHLIHRQLSPGTVLSLEGEHKRKDGTTFPVEIRLSSLAPAQPGLVIATVRDITERKRAEEEKARLETQLQQAQKMESVGRLAGGVAHDFNNMLGVILGHAELALERMDPAQPLYDDLTEIQMAASRSADLTRQLLAFARRQTIAPTVLDLNATVERTLALLRRLIGEAIDLVWRPGSNAWNVKLDPSQLDQILANLCVNARDAIAGVGKVTIETENATLDDAYCAGHLGFVPGEYVRLTVSDDGCGMDKDTQARLFEPFFTTKPMGHGTGLGLSTVYGIVKQNRGFINVYSEPGVGSTFTIYLPRHGDGGGSVQLLRTADAASRGQETVLVVEDDVAVLQVTARMIGGHGYTVLSASTPGEALRLATEHAGAIQLLVTDVVMPGMNGRDLARDLLSRCPGMKVLFTSGYTADVINDQGALDASLHFIHKPFSTRDLAAKMREVLDGD
jgi:PAS domain S-box-containing protein